jgi:ribonuclease HI
MHTVTVYCDGSSIGNPGPGGWGAVITSGKTAKELGGFDDHTTNNRMELTAAIESLKAIREHSNVTMHTDSQYVIQGITKWVYGWTTNEWQTKEKKDVLNKDLWQALMKAADMHSVSWEHVRGHAGVMLNERVDQIANGFARREKVKLFSGTEKEYYEFLKDMPKARAVTSRSKGKAYSYVSSVDGKIMTHATWKECEKRVRGKNAKYKKVLSKDEETALIALWST